MKKFRQRFLEVKEGFLDSKIEGQSIAIEWANILVIGVIYLAVCYSSMIFMAFGLENITNTIIIIAIIAVAIFMFVPQAFFLVIPLTTEIVIYLFGRYGRVVTKQDWKNIKKKCPKGYKEIWKKKSIGHCYYYSRGIALYLEDAQLLYCYITKKDGKKTGHAVIVKNNCVYCTNERRHFDLEEYKKIRGVEVYKIFSKNEYCSSHFFYNIREDFKKWCAEKNAYCDPQ